MSTKYYLVELPRYAQCRTAVNVNGEEFRIGMHVTRVGPFDTADDACEYAADFAKPQATYYVEEWVTPSI